MHTTSLRGSFAPLCAPLQSFYAWNRVFHVGVLRAAVGAWAEAVGSSAAAGTATAR